MSFSEVFQTMNQASAFEPLRQRAAIGRALDEPSWLQAIQTRAQQPRGLGRNEVVSIP